LRKAFFDFGRAVEEQRQKEKPEEELEKLEELSTHDLMHMRHGASLLSTAPPLSPEFQFETSFPQTFSQHRLSEHS
jgi:hypothetical protein